MRRALKALFTWTVALLILFEEWGWVPLANALARLGRLPFFRWLEARIHSLPPVKLFALWLIGEGQSFLGLTVIVVAKIAGTAVVARLFMLTRPALMQLPWFARLYGRWTAWKDALIARVRASPAWQAIGRAKAQVRAAWARLKIAIQRSES